MRRARAIVTFVNSASSFLSRSSRGFLVSSARRICATPCPRAPLCTLADVETSSLLRKRDLAVTQIEKSSTAESLNDTIFALSSGPAGSVSGVAVVRVSGPSAHRAVSLLLKPGSSLPPARRAAVRGLIDPRTGLPLDEAIVLIFRGPASFTGEDVAELHVHGSRAVVRATIAALSTMTDVGVRPANRGEFSRRAFENGRLDLTAAEGLADLLAAETESQRVQALQAVGGGARKVLEGWRADAKQCLAHAEAVIDFGDDVDDAAFQDVVPRARKLREEIEDRLVRDGRQGEIVRDGMKVAIVGPPNVGKSSLLNAIARRDVAIVSDVPGTTRDVLSVALDLQGFAVTIADTAGIRDVPSDKVEAEGIRRARMTADDADIKIVMSDAREVVNDSSNLAVNGTHVTSGDEADGSAFIRIANKVDLLDERGIARIPADMLHLSLTNKSTLTGVDNVVTAIGEAVRIQMGRDGKSASAEMPVVTRARHRHHLSRAVAALDGFVKGRSGLSNRWLPMDIAAEELRIACRELGAITGVVHVEEVLDVIFRDFCIGK